MLIMRELTGGLYFGERHTTTENGVRKAVDTLTYTEEEIRRIAIKAFDVARKRRRQSDERGQGKRAGFLETVEKRGGRGGKGLS